jgi:hypothetical protein
MKIFFSNLQRVVELNIDLLEGVSKFFPVLKKSIIPIRDLLIASKLNATHVINGPDEKWIGLLKSSLDFIARANELNIQHKKQGLTGEALLQKMDDVCLLNLDLADLEALEVELMRIHTAFDNAMGVKDGLKSIESMKSTVDVDSFKELLVDSPLITSSVRLGESKRIRKFYLEDIDLDIEVVFSGSEFENDFFDKWLIQDEVGPIKLESFVDSFSFESEDDFLKWFNNFRAQFQTQLGLNTLTSFFESGDVADVKKIQQIRHDLTEIMRKGELENRTMLSTKLEVWKYIYSHLNALENADEKRTYVELKSVYDLEEQQFRINFY